MARTLQVIFLLCLGVSLVACQLGTISVTFQDEDPTTGTDVDSTLLLGESVEVTIRLNPAPSIPIRLDIVSTNPSVIKVTHNTVTFNRGQQTAVITLESPTDGKIGVVDIIIAPEKLGLYHPLDFTILVQGTVTLGFVEPDCVAASLGAKMFIKLDPPALEDITFQLSTQSGTIDPETVVITTGIDSAEFTFTGSRIGATHVSSYNYFYLNNTLNFQVLGRILTEGPARLLQGAPSNVSITVFPDLFVGQSVSIDTFGGNADRYPESFVLGCCDPFIQEIVPFFYGISNVTYVAENYCPHTDIYIVDEAVICVLGSEPNVVGDTCLPCPGTVAPGYTNQRNVCFNRGECSWTHCSETDLRCDCEDPWIGFACQWDSINDADVIDTAVLNDQPFEVVVNLPFSSGPSVLSAPGNLVNPNYQPGLTIVNAYDPQNPFFGSVNPAVNPPTGSVYTGMSFNWENDCDENGILKYNFTSPVSGKFALDEEVFTLQDMLEIELYLWRNNSWVDSRVACDGAGFANQTRVVDLHAYTITAPFCQPGQYALFIIPVGTTVPTTGIRNNPHPNANEISAQIYLQATGWQQAPPLPLPVFAGDYYPSIPQALNQLSDSSASMIVSSIACLLIVLLML